MSEARDPESNRIDAESAESVKSCPAKVTRQMAAHYGAKKAAQHGVQMAGHDGVPKEFQATTICGNCGADFAPKCGASGQFCSRQCVSPGRSTLDENKIIQLYASGVGIKTIAKRLLGRETAKNTIRDALKRNGVQIRTVQEMAKDPASILRRLIGRGVVVDSKSVFKKKIKTTARTGGLELFDYAKRAAKKAGEIRSYHAQNAKAIEAGFRSSYHAKYQTDGAFRAKEIARRRFKKFVGEGLGERAGKFIGCSWDEFRLYLETQWEDWMNWENIGPIADGFWQIDHIVPCSWFDHERNDHARLCWHHLNMRPISSRENSKRSNRPTDLIETLKSLPECEIKNDLIAFVLQSVHFQPVTGPLTENYSARGRREPVR
jgi:hypothetical protein